MKDAGTVVRRVLPLLAGVGVLASLLVAAAMMGDLRRSGDLVGALRWSWLSWLIPLAVVNHAVRYWRWETLLRQIASRDLNRTTSVLIFCAGSLLIFTPARLGEVAKSVYARHYFGISVSRSLPILVAERLADFAVMAALAIVGLILLRDTTSIWLAGGILVATAFLFTLAVPLLERLARPKNGWLRLGPGLNRILNHVNESRRVLLTPRTLRTNLSLGSTAWTLEVSIYFLSLAAVGAAVDPQLFALALAVFPLASIGGSISFLPGGLGVTEGGLAALGILLGDLPGEVAVLAALLSRAAILGVVVVAGLVSLALLGRSGRQVVPAE